MCRKQPTPTDILENPNLTEMDQLVFLYIRPRVRNSDWVCVFTHAKREYALNMKRWQCIFKASVFSELVDKDVKYFKKSLQRISDFYSKMDIKGMPYWYLITRLYYDDLVSMDNKGIIEGEKKDNKGRANKSVKSEKNEKKDNKPLKKIFDNVDDYYNDIIEWWYIDKRMPSIDHERIKQRIEDMLIVIAWSEWKYEIPSVPKTHFQNWNKDKKTWEFIYKKTKVRLSDDKIRK